MVQAPAKLILSGEHAVVYNQTALAVAVDCYATSKVQFQTTIPSILFKLVNISYNKVYSLQSLFEVKKRLQQNYLKFLQGKHSIKKVLEKPFELLQYTIGNVIEKLNVTLSKGLELKCDSDIPIGCGMGSSAAIIVSTLMAFAKLLGLNLDDNYFMNLAKEAENLQHGKSSGLDIQLALNGGCKYLVGGRVQSSIKPKLTIYTVNTGPRISTSGEAVEHVAKHFKTSNIFTEFADVTATMHASIANNNISGIQQAVTNNHNLLTKINVVPAKIGNFINQLDKLGVAAKICGAGAVRGDSAGIVWLVPPEDVDKTKLDQLCAEYKYDLQKLQMDNQGAQLVKNHV